MTQTPAEPWNGGLTNDLSRILLSEAEIKARTLALGLQLAKEYAGKDPLLVGILSGSFLFIADLVRAMNMHIGVDFMAVSSYGDRTTSSGVVRILKDLNSSIAGRDVVLVEDIVDTGLTLSYLLENLQTRHPASLRVCTLLDKREARKKNVELAYVGFECPNEFVVGYGLDYGGRYRNLPFIGVLRPEVYRKEGLMSALSMAFIEKLPKTDLHVHLDGSMRISTLIELAKQQGVALPAETEEGLKAAMGFGRNFGSLVDYLKTFDLTLQVLQDEESLFRVAYELAADAAAEGVRYMEVRYSPMLHTRKKLKLTKVVETVLRGLHDAQASHNIESNLIVCGIRNISPESSMRMAELVVAYKNRGVVGFDLAGAEYDYPPKDHSEAFSLVRQNNINVTIHAGEAYGPASIAQALHVCGAHRIGHGCRLREDGDLLRYVVDHRIPIEVCPSSNVQTGAVPSIGEHPLRLYFNLGARITVNTDNRLVTDTTVSKELHLMHTQLDFDFAELRQVLLNGFKSAFLPYHEKRRLMRTASAELDEFAKQLDEG